MREKRSELSRTVSYGRTPAVDLRVSSARGRWVLLATVLGSGVAMLDGTVVNVALPAIGRSFGASMAELQWTVNAYTLTLAGMILLGGALGDRYGRRRVFVIGLVWFALASALCGAAVDAPMLIASRAIQGVGGALLTPGSLAIIQASFAEDERSRAVGAWSGLGGVAGAAGPFLGGWLVGSVGWRWVFLLNLPLVAITVAVTLRHVPESSDETETGRFDVLGAVLAAAALAGITYALTEAAGATGWQAGVAAVIGIGCGAGFVLRERRLGGSAMLPLEIFSSRQFTAINVITFVVYGGMGIVFFLFVQMLQIVAGFSPLAAGISLLPFTILMLLLSSRAGWLARRAGPRLPLAVGLAVAACGMLLMMRIGHHASYVNDVLPAVFVFGLGMTAVVAPLTATVLAAADVRHAGVASGVNNAVARAASLLMVAAIPPIVGLTGAAEAHPARFAHGFREAVVISAVMLAAGAVLSLLTVRDDVLRAPAVHPPQCEINCAVSSPPLEPGPARG
jgi:EmrB/QacA subfamily drug resistance transporter